jgi:hypothetical protein
MPEATLKKSKFSTQFKFLCTLKVQILFLYLMSDKINGGKSMRNQTGEGVDIFS